MLHRMVTALRPARDSGIYLVYKSGTRTLVIFYGCELFKIVVPQGTVSSLFTRITQYWEHKICANPEVKHPMGLEPTGFSLGGRRLIH